MKKIKILLILIFITNITCLAQNQIIDHANQNKLSADGDYMYVLVDNKPLLIRLNDKQLTPLSTFVMDWYGAKYQLGGNTKNGIDCSQFAKKLYWDVYGKKLNNTCAEQWKQTTRIKKDSLAVGDIVFFRSTQSPSGWHCGVYLGKDTFVHAANKKEGVKISSLSEPRYLSSYKGAGRLD